MIPGKNALVLTCLFFLFSSVATSQVNNQSQSGLLCKNPLIEFVEAITSESLKDVDKGFLSIITDFFFGKDELTLVRPFSAILSNDGNLYIIDQQNNSIIRYSKEKKSTKNIFDASDTFKSLVSLCEFNNGLLFTDSQLKKVFKYDFSSEKVTEFNSQIEQPAGIIFLENFGEVWISDTKQHKIIRLDPEGNIVGNIGKRGNGISEFNFPTFMWYDGSDKIYINDSMNSRIQIFSTNGDFLYSFGKTGDGSGDLARPKGVATDSFNNIYVVDALFNNVQIFDQSGRLLHIFGEQGTEKGKFWLPIGIWIDEQNFIYISDSFNSRVQIFRLKCEN